MKTIKKITVTLTLVAIIASCAGCQLISAIINLYNVPSYSQRQYVEPDKEAIQELADEISELSKKKAYPANKQAIALKRNSFYLKYYEVLTSRLVAEIEYYKNVNDDTAKLRFQNISNYFNELQNTAIEMEKGLLTSSYKDMIIESAGQEYADTILNRPVKSEELLAAEARENELVNEYSTVYASGDKNGEEFKNKVADILKQLVVVRNKIASLNKKDDGTPYPNYHEYAYAEVYGRDYTPEQAAVFRSAIADNLYEVGKALTAESKKRLTSSVLSTRLYESQIKQMMPDIIKNTAPDMLSNWEYMIKLGLYDFTVSENKINSSFVAEFQQYGDGFMFINAKGLLLSDLSTVVHEFGHYNAIFAVDDDKKGSGNTYSYDLAETHSQGFELISMPAVKKVLTQNNLGDIYPAYECNLLTQSVWSMLSNSIFDEFEYTIYSADESALNREFFETTFDTVWKKYWTVGEDGKTTYQYYDIPHVYSSPSYCISYSVSMVFASEIWSSETAVAEYLNVVSYGADHYLGEVAKAVGLSSPLNADTVKSVADYYKQEITSLFGISFGTNAGGDHTA